MSQPLRPSGPGADERPGAPMRGLLLTAAAVALGIGILASVSKGAGPAASTPTAAVGTTTTTTAAPAAGSTTTTTTASNQPTHTASSVKILVANGTTTPGLAGKLKNKLTADGYDLLAPTNTSTAARASAVYYATGYQGDAQAVAAAAGLPASAVQVMPAQAPVSSTSGAQIILVIGPDLATTLQQ